jgi:hypothetical protein
MPQAPALTTGAYVLHNLGLATGFGGSLFGKVALNPAARVVSDKVERGKVVNAAWNGYNILNAIALGTTALTWFTGRTLVSGRSISRGARRLVLAKDVLLGSTLATGAVNLIGGAYLAKKTLAENVPMESGSRPAPEAPPDVKTVAKLVNWMGVLNIACMAGVIGLTTWLDTKAQRSARWYLFSRILP